MVQAPGSSWKDADVARHFLDERRRAVPLGDEQVAILLRLARHFVPQPVRVIDLGCGDGFLARAVLSEFPTARALMIDHSEPMLRRAHEAMRPFSGRCDIHQGDLSDPLAPQVGDGPFDLIVSGYAIHHLPTAKKRSLYAEVFGLLAPGGLVAVHSELGGVMHNEVGAYQDIHRWLSIGLPHPGPLSAIATAQDTSRTA